MNRRDFLMRSILTSCCCAIGGHVTASESKHVNLPNILLILADDMGYGDPQCYNAESKIPTPNMDQLAKEGMRFTDAHTPSSVCSPTRYGLLTGRYCWRTRLKQRVLYPFDPPLIEKGRVSLASMLKEKGYTTACIGKWHLGMNWGTPDNAPPVRRKRRDPVDLNKPIKGGPLTAGFDTYFGVDVPNCPPYCFIEDDHLLGPVPVKPKPDNMYGSPGLMQDGWDLHKILPTLRDRAVSFIEKSAEKRDVPFFLYMSLTSPHRPIVPNKEWAGKSKAGDYGDFIAETDGVIGDLLKILEQKGLKEDTIVIVTSDNGSCGPAGDLFIRGSAWHKQMSVTAMFGHYPNAPWRGAKAEIYEGGHRVPFLVRWPGKVKPGSRNDQTICLTDVFRTVASIVDYKVPENAGEDSFDILPTLIDPSKPIRSDVIHHSARGMFALRQGHWKLIEGQTAGASVREKTSPDLPPGQLYNISTDPGEKNNLYTNHPEIVERLTGLLNKHRKSGRSTVAIP